MKIAIASQKGGVGKTSCALNLAACLGLPTLLVDIDPQGGCAISLGIDADSLPHSIHDVLTERIDPKPAIIQTRFAFDLLPANIDLAETELLLHAMTGREYALKRALRSLEGEYETIVIDTPPTLGVLTINAFAAADAVLIPVSTQLLSLRGLSTLMETVEKIRRYEINPELQVLGIVPTKYDGRTVHARQVLEYLREFGREHGVPVFPPIRATVRFDEATNEQTPFVLLYPDDEATLAYEEIADGIKARA